MQTRYGVRRRSRLRTMMIGLAIAPPLLTTGAFAQQALSWRIVTRSPETIGDGVRAAPLAGAVGPNGLVALIEGDGRTLTLFETSGVNPGAQVQVRKRGSVPVEGSTSLLQIAVAGDSILVLDAGAERLITLKRVGLRVRQAGSYPVAGGSRGFCIMADSVVTYSITENHLLHLHHAGKVLRSFGEQILPGAGDAVRVSAAWGPMACLRQRSMVVVGIDLTGELLAYGMNGRILWRTRLPGFQPLSVSEGAEGDATFSMKAGGYDQFISLFPLDGQTVLVQSRRLLEAGVPKGNERTHSYLISSVNGAELGSLLMPARLFGRVGGYWIGLESTTVSRLAVLGRAN